MIRFYWEWRHQKTGGAPKGIDIFDRTEGSGDTYALTPVARVRGNDPELADAIVRHLNAIQEGR